MTYSYYIYAQANFMKNIQYFPLIIFIAFCLQACTGNDAKTYNEKAALPSFPTTSLPANNAEGVASGSLPQGNGTNALSNTAKPNPPHGQPGHRCGEAVGSPTAQAPLISPVNNAITNLPSPVTTPSIVNNGAKLNPAHGQPGHNCAVAVGAPLTGSAPSSSLSVPVQKTTPDVQTTVAPAAPVKTAPGINPPHGQPGHRCDISAGAPLNSKPAAVTTPSTTTTPAASLPAPVATPTSNTNPSPLQPAATLSEIFPDVTKTGKVKLNPAHGQPGHDCKIAVGKPLKQ
jgi:hypothetical protein